MPLLDILHDRVKLLKLFWIAYWASLALLAIGYVIILLDLLG